MEKRALLAALGDCRKALIRAETVLKPQGDTYRLCSAVVASIDALAGQLTGDLTYFAVKPHGR